MRLHCLALVAILAAVGPAAAIAQVPSSILDRLHQAEIENSIDGPDMKPWHLKMSFQTFADKGIEKDHGTIEEWWAPGKHRIVVSSHAYTGTELVNEAGRYLTPGVGSMPYGLASLLNGVVHPMPTTADEQNTKPELIRETIVNVPMDCLMLTQDVGLKMQAAVIGMFPAYCLARGTTHMIFSYDPGAEMVVLNSAATFAGHRVAVQVSLQDSLTVVAKAHVEALTSSPKDLGDFTTKTGLEDASAPAPRIPAQMMSGALQSSPAPIYPESAKQAHIAGIVLLKAIIGQDGHIRRLRVNSAPDGALALSALQAVRQWRYKPYLLNGVPIEVETTITVNYTFG